MTTKPISHPVPDNNEECHLVELGRDALQDYYEGKTIPLEEVKKKLNLK